MKLERSIVINLSIVALALGTAALLFVTRERPSMEEQAARQQNLFPIAFDERLVSLQIKTQARQFSLQIRRATPDQEPSYLLRTEASSPADPEAALGLLRALELVSFLRRFDSEAIDEKELGLLSPRAEVIADFGSFRSKVLVGKPAVSPPGSTYVQVEPGNGRALGVGLVRTEALKELWMDPDDLKPRGLLPLGSGGFVAISLEGNGHKLSLEKATGPAFVNETGQRVRRATTDRLLLELSTIQFERFLDEKALAHSVAAEATTRVSLRPKSESPPVVLSIGGRCPNSNENVVVQRIAPDRVAGCVSSTLLALLSDTASSLRDDAPFSLHVDEVDRLLIQRDAKKLELARTERGFQLRSPSQGDVGLAAGNRRLADVLSAPAEPVQHPNLTELGLMPPRGTLSLRSSVIEGVPKFEETIDLGRELPDGRLPIRRQLDGAVLLLSKGATRAYMPDSTLLRSTRIFDFGPSELEKFEIERAGVRQRLRRAPSGGLELLEPEGFELDGALALDLVQTLGTLEAERWIGEGDDPSHGLGAPSVTLTLEFAARDAGPKTQVLRIGKASNEGAFAKLDSDPSVFLVSKSLLSQTMGLLLSRSVFGSDRAKLEHIELERRGQRLSIERRGGSFASSQGTALSLAIVERIVETVSDLRAEAALHTGPARPEEGFGSGLVLRLREDSPGNPRKTLRIGAGDTFRDVSVFYGRIDGIDATYALPQSSVRPLLDAF